MTTRDMMRATGLGRARLAHLRLGYTMHGERVPEVLMYGTHWGYDDRGRIVYTGDALGIIMAQRRGVAAETGRATACGEASGGMLATPSMPDGGAS